MELLRQSAERIELAMDVEELRIINNALNEVCNALPRAGFQTRMGTALPEVKALLDEVNALLPANLDDEADRNS